MTANDDKKTGASSGRTRKEPRTKDLRILVKPSEKDRIEAFINNEYSSQTNISELGRQAIVEFLDREERILELSKKQIEKIREAQNEIANIRKKADS